MMTSMRDRIHAWGENFSLQSWKGWGNAAAQAFFVAIVVLLLLILATVIYRAYFDQPPIHVVPLTQPPQVAICANQSYEVVIKVTSTKTTLISFYLVVRDKEYNHYVDRNQMPLFEIPTEGGITFVQRLPWTVPDLPPGEYTRILALRGHDRDQAPLVFPESFTIGGSESCNE